MGARAQMCCVGCRTFDGDLNARDSRVAAAWRTLKFNARCKAFRLRAHILRYIRPSRPY